MKRTTDWRWAHLSCALWIPEVFFRGPDGREPIDIMQIPSHRWGNRCCHCGDTHGAAMTCAHAGCNKYVLSFYLLSELNDSLLISFVSFNYLFHPAFPSSPSSPSFSFNHLSGHSTLHVVCNIIYS